MRYVRKQRYHQDKCCHLPVSWLPLLVSAANTRHALYIIAESLLNRTAISDSHSTVSIAVSQTIARLLDAGYTFTGKQLEKLKKLAPEALGMCTENSQARTQKTVYSLFLLCSDTVRYSMLPNVIYGSKKLPLPSILKQYIRRHV